MTTKPTTCRYCGGPLEQRPGPGRPRVVHPECRGRYNYTRDLARRRHRVARLLTDPDAISAGSRAERRATMLASLEVLMDDDTEPRRSSALLAEAGYGVTDLLGRPETFLEEYRRWRRIEEEAREAREIALRALIDSLTEEQREAAIERGRARWLRWAEEERLSV